MMRAIDLESLQQGRQEAKAVMMYCIVNSPVDNPPEDYTHTLSKISNWSPYMFYSSFESKIRLNKIHAFINKPRLYRDSAGHFI